MPTLNIAAYKFAELQGLPELRTSLKELCHSLELKGSILLSPEGINLFIAGEPSGVEKLLSTLRSIPGLETLEEKRSVSEEQPFNRMLVKIKEEIIAFGVEGINPARHTSPRIPAKELKRWIDEGREFTLLDTRNTYEVKLGTFAGATTLPIRHFRKFPEAVAALPEEVKQKPVVSFCTGGIRCEKAAPFLEHAGFREVYQLEGGILKYFEECGGAHWNGECFVFDKRVGVDPALQETGSQLCFACQEPLTAEEVKDPRYVYEVSCPYCFDEKG
jgi:predicted sulfurtransferase